jgi:hypothetical protein
MKLGLTRLSVPRGSRGMSSGKRKRTPTREGAERRASGAVHNVMASGPRANAQRPFPVDTKERTKAQRV